MTRRRASYSCWEPVSVSAGRETTRHQNPKRHNHIDGREDLRSHHNIRCLREVETQLRFWVWVTLKIDCACLRTAYCNCLIKMSPVVREEFRRALSSSNGQSYTWILSYLYGIPIGNNEKLTILQVLHLQLYSRFSPSVWGSSLKSLNSDVVF